MAGEHDRWPRWAAEQAGTHDPPALRTLILVMVLAVVIGLLLLPHAAATDPRWRTPPTTPPPCSQHFPPTCTGR
jgi:hypothetical protein